MRKALTIAGSDSGGGAGIQADLKTIAALGVYGTSVLTAVTAQNTVGVQGIHELPASFVALQIDSVLQDIGADAIKIGMLSSASIVEAVAERLRKYKAAQRVQIVVDPVMAAKSDDLLLGAEARQALIQYLLPLADVVTPNLVEAQALTGIEVHTEADMRHVAEAFFEFGARYVVVKGGHLPQNMDCVDLLYDGNKFDEYRAPRTSTRNDHGTGCTFASAIAAELAKGEEMDQAVTRAKKYLTQIMQASVSLRIGNGHGPLHHFALMQMVKEYETSDSNTATKSLCQNVLDSYKP